MFQVTLARMDLRIKLTALLTLFAAGAEAQSPDIHRTVDIEQVTVTERRILEDIGARKTVLDTVSLRDNVTNSMADVLSQASSIFIKSYGRATLSTASFRGTAPSHTQVTWNGMKMNSPMLGMVDFSLIPSYFVDDASLYHGAGSVGVTGGGLGGAVVLSTRPAYGTGPGVRYIQGIGSYGTFDEFLRFTYGSPRLQTSTRIYYATSDNDFKYTNYRKKDYVYDDDNNIVDWSYPKERNKNGSFKDFHALQEFYYDAGAGNRLGGSVWFTDSRRGVPMLNVDYKDESRSKNRQDEQTVRATVSWDRYRADYKLYANAGYTYTDLKYLYLGDLGNGTLQEMIHSQSYVNTAYGRFGVEYYPGTKWMFAGNVSVHQHFVKSMDRAIVTQSGEATTVGYDQARVELSAFASVKYRPVERLGLAVNIRQELYGSDWTPVIPAFFADYLLSRAGEVTVKASVARNFRYPTLNDLYFMPGGNPDLKTEKGYTYDFGAAFGVGDADGVRFQAEVSAFDSRIRDWIVWLPTFKGFWSPVNVKKVHSYGLETKGRLAARFGRGWSLTADGVFALTNSINYGDPASWGDESIGKQLVYIPKYSSAVTGKLGWRTWMLTWKWNWYSERFTTSSNETATRLGRLEPYYMNDVSLEKLFGFKRVGVSLKFAVNNLFGEEYESVLSRPMAGRNYGLYIEITPLFRKKK